MPGFTTPDGFIYPVQGDQPFTGLTPDIAGVEVFQEQVQTKITGLEVDTIGDIDSRLTVVEAASAASRWRHIDEGTESGEAFDITVPAGFAILRLYLLGDLDGNGTVRLRINGDSTSGLHRQGFISRAAETAARIDDIHTEDTAWRLANWGTVSGNTCEVRIICPTGVSGAPSYRSFGERLSGTAGSHIESTGWGSTTSNRTVSSLNIRPFSDASNDFATCHWWLEGRLA